MPRRFEVCTYRVLVRIKAAEEKTKSGLYIPEQARDRMDMTSVEGTIVGMGPQAFKAFGDGSMQAKVGDQVMFAKYCGSDFEEDGVKFRIMNDEDVLCVIVPDAETEEDGTTNENSE